MFWFLWVSAYWCARMCGGEAAVGVGRGVWGYSEGTTLQNSFSSFFSTVVYLSYHHHLHAILFWILYLQHPLFIYLCNFTFGLCPNNHKTWRQRWRAMRLLDIHFYGLKNWWPCHAAKVGLIPNRQWWRRPRRKEKKHTPVFYHDMWVS